MERKIDIIAEAGVRCSETLRIILHDQRNPRTGSGAV